MSIERYNLTESQEKEIWADAIFVFDTSALLNLYGYSEETRNDIFQSIFEKIRGRLLLPFNVYFEYNNNRQKSIYSPIELYEDLKKNLKAISDNFQQIEDKTKSAEKHPFVDANIIQKFRDELKNFTNTFKSDIKSKIETIKNSDEKDDTKTLLDNYFKTGNPFTYSQIIEIIKEGEFRYRHSIPPGYKDEKDKDGFQKFGDLIIWKQLLEFAKDNKGSVVLVIDDLKEDWWILNKTGKPVKPRVELIDEVFEIAHVKFWMYTSSDFINASKKYIDSKIKDDTIEEVKEITYNDVEKFVDGIYLSANREEREPGRLKRLLNVVNFLKKNYGKLDIKELHDHKGDLTVVWLKDPSEIEKNIVGSAWEEENELRDNVKHIKEGESWW